MRLNSDIEGTFEWLLQIPLRPMKLQSWVLIAINVIKGSLTMVTQMLEETYMTHTNLTDIVTS